MNKNTYKILSIAGANLSNLEIAELLFKKAKSISRNTDFTKADSYDGLIKIYSIKLALGSTLTEHEKKEILNNIEEFKAKKEEINKSLTRVK